MKATITDIKTLWVRHMDKQLDEDAQPKKISVRALWLAELTLREHPRDFRRLDKTIRVTVDLKPYN